MKYNEILEPLYRQREEHARECGYDVKTIFARLLSAWQVGHGDYLVLRDKFFAGETVDGLYQQAQAASKP